MTTPLVNPVITVHKVFQSDTSGQLLAPLYKTFELLTQAFTVPIVGNTASILVVDSSIYAVGQYIYIPGAGFFAISSIPSDDTIYVLNMGSTGNYAAGTVVPATTPFFVCPPPSTVPATYTFQQAGQTALADTSAADDTLLIHVDYPVAFAVPPSAVILQIESNVGLGTLVGAVALYVRNKDEVGFDIYYSATGVFSLTVDWIAIA